MYTLVAKKLPGKTREEAQREKKQELEARLKDVTGHLQGSKKPIKKGNVIQPSLQNKTQLLPNLMFFVCVCTHLFYKLFLWYYLFGHWFS